MKIRKLTRRNRPEWVLDYYEGPKRIRRWFKSKGAAEAAADDLKHQVRNTGQAWIELSPAERNDLMNVIAEARERKVTIRQVWEAYRNGKLDATPMQRCTLGRAITETIEWRRGENLRDRYLKELEAYLKRFAAGRSEMFLDQIGVVEIQTWFSSREEALSTRRANIGRLGSLFDVAWKKGYIKENPCLKLPTVKLRQEAPTIFTPAQTKTLLQKCAEEFQALLPVFVLGTFAGIRPEEMQKLRWADIDLKHATVRIDVATAKTSRRRSVPLSFANGKTLIDPALQWLKLCKAGEPDELVAGTEVTMRRHRRSLAELTGIAWHQDIMRHTAGSYLLQLRKNAHEVAMMLGNSARILERHYKDLVNETDCQAFWALTPDAVLKGK